jgi:thioesterase-3
MFAHVNNARYLEFLEDARWDWLNKTIDYKYFIKNDISFIVASVTINYRAPAVLNDILTITAATGKIGNRSGQIEQKVIRKSDDKLIADATITFAVVNNKSGKSVPLEGELLEILNSHG